MIRAIQQLKLDLLIAVVDDSSPDETGEIVRNLQKDYDNILLFSRQEKLGLGTAITLGFKHLMKLKEPPSYIVTMDADYSHDPRDIPSLVYAAEDGDDLVIGSRYYKGGKVIGSQWRRRMISRFANYIAALIVGARIHDCTSGFRCYSKNYIKTVLPDIHSQTYEIQIETLRQAHLHGFSIKEIAVTFVNRKKGKSKLTAFESQAFVTYIMKTTWQRLISFLNHATKAN